MKTAFVVGVSIKLMTPYFRDFIFGRRAQAAGRYEIC